MARYRYLIPSISAAPPPGYRMTQVLPLEPLRELLLPGRDAVVAVRRAVLRAGEVLTEDLRQLTLHYGEWTDPSVAEFTFDSSDEEGWRTEGDIAYVETAVSLETEGWFGDHFLPSFYTVYSSPSKKTFFSDNALKFGSPNVIKQIARHGKWVEGYPVVHVDPARDANESVLVINPFEKESFVKVQSVGEPARSVRRRVPALGATRVDLSRVLGDAVLPWSGQVFVSGPSRMVIYFAKHGVRDNTSITTVEHSDVYRGTATFLPATVLLRRWAGSALGLRR